MAITIIKNASTGNVTITETSKPLIKLCNHGAVYITNNDTGTHINIITDNYDGHLLLTDITTIGTNTGGPFSLATALGYLDDLFKK
jgi:hypothetical protein